MKALSQIALLAAAVAVAVPFASADQLTGHITFTDDPIYFTYDTGVLTILYVDPNPTNTPNPINQPINTDGAPTLGNYYASPILDTFSTNSPSGTTIFTGVNPNVSPNDTVTFKSSSVSAVTTNGTEYVFNVSGLLTSSDFATTNGTDLFTIDPTGTTLYDDTTVQTGSLTEVLTAQTPEPSSLMLLGTGLMSAGGMLVRRRKLSV